MTSLDKMSKDSLKLKHEEYKLFLQIIWSGVLTFTISLLLGSFTHTIELEPMIAILAAAIIILFGIVITLFSFTGKFNEIRENIDKNNR